MLLGARPALCTLHTCYRFICARYHVATRLWTETRAELVAVRGLVIFSQSEWTLSWNTRVYSTDSSLSGLGMTHAGWPKEVAGRTGRVSERRLLSPVDLVLGNVPWPPVGWSWTMVNGLSRELTTKMRKSASMLIFRLMRSLRVGSNVVGGICPVFVVGLGVKITSSWKQERG